MRRSSDLQGAKQGVAEYHLDKVNRRRAARHCGSVPTRRRIAAARALSTAHRFMADRNPRECTTLAHLHREGISANATQEFCARTNRCRRFGVELITAAVPRNGEKMHHRHRTTAANSPKRISTGSLVTVSRMRDFIPRFFILFIFAIRQN